VWGGEEEIIDKPVSPGDIKNILYTQCFPYDVSQAVLQQELIINIGTFITTNPELFNGMLKIRIGYVRGQCFSNKLIHNNLGSNLKIIWEVL